MRHRWQALLGLVALLAMLPGCSQVLKMVGTPSVKGVRARITHIDLESVGLAFDIKVDNPYPFALKSPRVTYGVAIEGEDILSAHEALDVRVPANTLGVVTIPVQVSYARVWDAYRKLADAKEFHYRLHGTVAFPLVGSLAELPLSHSGTAPVLRAPKLSNPRVRFSDVSLRNAKVTFQADMVNPNIFAVSVQDLGYRLTLGDVAVGNLVAATGGKIEPDGRGRLSLTGQIAAADALVRILAGAGLGKPKLSLVGRIDTPYGKVNLDRKKK